ncbi:MAG TPA: hypothetical protein VME43_02780 [Bryobacteraceae bacterium]|nr:hypothetical protein [Bryobacteraceae bacterium]
MRLSVTPLRIGLLALAGAAAAFGQSVSFLRPGSIEVGPFLGASYGIVNAQYMAGGNFTVAANKYILPYVEFTYLPQVASPPVVSSLPAGVSSVSVDRNISFYDFHGGVHIRFPIHEKPFVPYLAVGVGVLHHLQTTVTPTLTYTDGTTQTLPAAIQPGGSDFAVNFGGGVRYYFSSAKFGMRAEVKVYKPTGSMYSSVFGKAEIGLFYQFR